MEKLSTSPPSPLSPTLWPAEAFSPRRVALFIAALVGAGIVSVILAVLAVAVDGHPAIDAQKAVHLTRGLVIGQLLAYVPLLVVALPLLPRTAVRSLRDIGWRAPRWTDVAIGLIGTVAMYLAAAIGGFIQQKVFHVTGKETAVALFGTTHDPVLVAAFSAIAIVFAPIVEELLFRGFLLNALLRYMPVGIAIVVDGILFGLGHGDKNAALPLALGGAVLAAVYYRTGSLAASTITHATFNGVNVIIILLIGDKAL